MSKTPVQWKFHCISHDMEEGTCGGLVEIIQFILVSDAGKYLIGSGGFQLMGRVEMGIKGTKTVLFVGIELPAVTSAAQCCSCRFLSLEPQVLCDTHTPCHLSSLPPGSEDTEDSRRSGWVSRLRTDT